jgi:S-sulfo-L-cysteine synthase (3-phospho-L-serine-dependent)
VSTVAHVAQELGLPGNTPEAVTICRDKGLMRRRTADASLPSPGFALIKPSHDLDQQVLDALSRIALPCVVKPVDDTGSSDVLLCATPEQVTAHCRKILSATTNVRGQRSARTALIESYLDGPEFSLEMISSHRGHECVGITSKLVTPPPYFVERGHIFPAPLPPDAAEALIDVARRALAVTGISNGVSHVEMKIVDGMGCVVEINARPAGGMIPEVIAQSCEFDLLGAHIRAAVGLTPPPLPMQFTPAGIAFLLAPETLPGPEATLDSVAGVAQARGVPGVTSVVITAHAGTTMKPARSSYDRLGYVIAKAPDHTNLTKTLNRAAGFLRPVSRAADFPVGKP